MESRRGKFGRFAFWRKPENVAPEPEPYPEITLETARQELDRVKGLYSSLDLSEANVAQRTLYSLNILGGRIHNRGLMEDSYNKDRKEQTLYLPPIGKRIVDDVLGGLDPELAALRIQEAKMKYLAAYQELGVDMNLHIMAYYAKYLPPRDPLPNPFEE
ncbi:MAG TPA: hypothetical protein VG917_04515 [Patescibacteria group bacterium]|nr:hypothetical protein [Patescibacteria group bacterium]